MWGKVDITLMRGFFRMAKIVWSQIVVGANKDENSRIIHAYDHLLMVINKF
jgi:hypothetical protein